MKQAALQPVDRCLHPLMDWHYPIGISDDCHVHDGTFDESVERHQRKKGFDRPDIAANHVDELTVGWRLANRVSAADVKVRGNCQYQGK